VLRGPEHLRCDNAFTVAVITAKPRLQAFLRLDNSVLRFGLGDAEFLCDGLGGASLHCPHRHQLVGDISEDDGVRAKPPRFFFNFGCSAHELLDVCGHCESSSHGFHVRSAAWAKLDRNLLHRRLDALGILALLARNLRARRRLREVTADRRGVADDLACDACGFQRRIEARGLAVVLRMTLTDEADNGFTLTAGQVISTVRLGTHRDQLAVATLAQNAAVIAMLAVGDDALVVFPSDVHSQRLIGERLCGFVELLRALCATSCFHFSTLFLRCLWGWASLDPSSHRASSP